MTFTFAPDAAIAHDPTGVFAYAFERPQDGLLVDALVDRAFGPGRYAKTAERIRERAKARRDLSICVWAGETLIGSVRQWSIRIGDTPAIFLGPIEVEARERKHGLGASLMHHAIDLAEAAGERLVLLVGDMPYFGQFGFEVVPPGLLAMPGPVDPRRMLWRALGEHDLQGVAGPVRGV